jgi:AcrR family transcriptional regulator
VTEHPPVPDLTDMSSSSAPAALPASVPPPGEEPKRGRPGYDQRQVLDIAVSAFIEHGYDATSMGVLATRLGLSKSAIYHHFPSKGDLLRLALDEALTALEGVLTAPEAVHGRAADRLAFVLRGAVIVLVNNLSYVTLLLRVHGNTDVERDALARRRAFDRFVTALVVEARDEGSLRSDIDPRIVTRLLFGMINSIVEWYRPGGPESTGQLADDILAVALDGLRTPASNRVGDLLG